MPRFATEIDNLDSHPLRLSGVHVDLTARTGGEEDTEGEGYASLVPYVHWCLFVPWWCLCDEARVLSSCASCLPASPTRLPLAYPAVGSAAPLSRLFGRSSAQLGPVLHLASFSVEPFDVPVGKHSFDLEVVAEVVRLRCRSCVRVCW